MKHNKIKKIVLTGLFTAFGVLFPIIFHLVGLGSAMLPIHIPVLLCGFVCGCFYGGICGVLSVIMSSFFTGMPPMYPQAVTMVFELFAYGFFSGLFIKTFKKDKIVYIYIYLIIAMLIGRMFSAAASAALIGLKEYTFTVFITSSFVKSLPGILMQLILIPVLVKFILTYSKLDKDYGKVKRLRR